jgi:hypothetical protein
MLLFEVLWIGLQFGRQRVNQMIRTTSERLSIEKNHVRGFGGGAIFSSWSELLEILKLMILSYSECTVLDDIKVAI